MTPIFPRQVTLRDGLRILLREATAADAEPLLERVDRIAGESANIPVEPGEFPLSLRQERELLEQMRRSDNQLFLLATAAERIIGDISFRGGAFRRTRHAGTMGMSVDRSHWGRGIGGALLQGLIDWARTGGVVRKINLKVIVPNTRAIALYHRFGFHEEGRHTRTFMVDDGFVDDISMGLDIDPDDLETGA